MSAVSRLMTPCKTETEPETGILDTATETESETETVVDTKPNQTKPVDQCRQRPIKIN